MLFLITGTDVYTIRSIRNLLVVFQKMKNHSESKKHRKMGSNPFKLLYVSEGHRTATITLEHYRYE
jgi:hypothetical protein